MSENTITQKVDFTEEELKFLNYVLIEVRDKAIYPASISMLEEIRDKLSEAARQAREERKGNRPNCEEDGHTWGEQSIHNDWIIRGCNYCPKGQRRKSLEDDWETREMSDIL